MEASLTHSPASLLQSRTTSNQAANQIQSRMAVAVNLRLVRCGSARRAHRREMGAAASQTEEWVGSIHGWVGHMVGRPAVSPRLGAHHRRPEGSASVAPAWRPSASCGRAGPCYRDGRERLRLQKTAIAVDSFAYPTSAAPCLPLRGSLICTCVCVLRPDAPFQPQRSGELAASPKITDQYPPQKRRRHTGSQPRAFPSGACGERVFSSWFITIYITC